MILSRVDIAKAIEVGEIRFDPQIDEDQLGQASVDLRLGHHFTKWKDGIRGLKLSVANGLGIGAELWDERVLQERDSCGKPETVSLEPGEFILAMTHEVVTVPRSMIALIEGRSTYARVGLSMHQTAPWIQPGWVGRIILEIRNSGPLTIELTPLVDRPCQLVFFQLLTPLPPEHAYGANPQSDVYQNQQHPLRHKRNDPT